MSIQIHVSDDREIREMLARCQNIDVDAREEVGEAEAALFRRHFEELPPNKRFPGSTTGFWKEASRATSFAVTEKGVVITVNKIGVRQRLEGGEIRPTGGRKWLTIPMREEAYGKAATEFNNLRFIQVAGDTALLVETDAQAVNFGRKRKDGSRGVKSGAESGGLAMFLLKRSVNQVGDPGVIPGDDEITRTAHEAIKRVLFAGGAN